MAEIEINIVKSWNEIQWIDSPKKYLLDLIKIAKTQFADAQNLSDLADKNDWKEADGYLSSLIHKIISQTIITQTDRLKSPTLYNWVPQKSTILLLPHLLHCIELLQKIILQRGKIIQFNIAQIADRALNKKHKPRKEWVYLSESMVFPSFSYFDLNSTSSQINKNKKAAPQLALSSFLGLVGFLFKTTQLRSSLTPVSKNINSENPRKPEKPNIPPPIAVDVGEGGFCNFIHAGRKTKISFHRTLRIPEDGNNYPLPAGLGEFPIHRVEDYADSVPPQWLEEGGFFIPLYQREALFIQFEGEERCPSIAKVCVGRINAITGKPYTEELSGHNQDYVVIPKQKWLDGINSGDGTVKQFVAMPLGQGYTIEAQITDEEQHGGFQLVVYEPMDGRFKEPESTIEQKVAFLKRISTANFNSMLKPLTKRERIIIDLIREGCTAAGAACITGMTKEEVIKFYINFRNAFFERAASNATRHFINDRDCQTIVIKTLGDLREFGLEEDIDPMPEPSPSISGKPQAPRIESLGSSPSQPRSQADSDKGLRLMSSPEPHYFTDVKEMGIAAGGKIRQQIFHDTYGVESWDSNRRRPLKIHMVNSMAYKSITGQDPPPSPVTAEQYRKAAIPWFSQYDETTPSVKSAGAFNRIIGVGAIDKRRGVTDSPPISSIHINPDVIRRIKTPDLKEAIQNFRKRAREDAEAGRWTAALRGIDYLIDLEAGVEAQDYAIRSICNYRIKRYMEGMFDGDKALELDPDCLPALSSRAFCRLALGDLEELRDDAELLIKTIETEALGLELKAETSLISGNYHDAVYDALYLKKKYPGNERAEQILGEARVKANEQFRALKSPK